MIVSFIKSTEAYRGLFVRILFMTRSEVGQRTGSSLVGYFFGSSFHDVLLSEFGKVTDIYGDQLDFSKEQEAQTILLRLTNYKEQGIL